MTMKGWIYTRVGKVTNVNERVKLANDNERMDLSYGCKSGQ
jgi:hypothetical protein